jgi:hypothetical protein
LTTTQLPQSHRTLAGSAGCPLRRIRSYGAKSMCLQVSMVGLDPRAFNSRTGILFQNFAEIGSAASSCHTGEGRYPRPQWVPTFVGMARWMRLRTSAPGRGSCFGKVGCGLRTTLHSRGRVYRRRNRTAVRLSRPWAVGEGCGGSGAPDLGPDKTGITGRARSARCGATGARGNFAGGCGGSAAPRRRHPRVDGRPNS